MGCVLKVRRDEEELGAAHWSWMHLVLNPSWMTVSGQFFLLTVLFPCEVGNMITPSMKGF